MKSLLIKYWYVVAVLILVNFLLRLLIYYNTSLFSFSDYSAYLGGIDNLAKGDRQYLLFGNFLFAVSYMGYFAREILGSLDWFFILNCMLGSLTGLIIYIMVIRITGMKGAGVAALVILTLYTEYMVFSSVFYTPVIMLFLVSLFILMLYNYLEAEKRVAILLSGATLTAIFFLTFFFKPELKYLPCLLLVPGFLFLKRERSFSIKILFLALLLSPISFLLPRTGIITAPDGNVISNAFVFFGHTDYGGDGGEGSFVYPANRQRYDDESRKYFEAKKIIAPNTADFNAFQSQEIKKYITKHPLKWAGLQAKKFFRTFGVVPETNSFKVLYTGLLKGRFWLTIIVVVVPVAVLIVLFILLFNIRGLRTRVRGSELRAQGSELRAQGAEHSTKGKNSVQPVTGYRLPDTRSKSLFLYVYLLLFFYYLFASVFYGHYQERYRMPLMVLFIIPVLGYFIVSFNLKEFLSGRALLIKAVVILLFLTVWVVQTVNAVSNKDRLEKALESIGNQYSVISNR